MPEAEVKRLCDVHVAVFKEALEAQEIPEAPPGHPVHTFMLENRAAEKIMERIEDIIGPKGRALGDQDLKGKREELAGLLEDLSRIHLHYLRKENQLFPLLEAHDISGPSQVMWAIHDDIRALMKKAQEHLSANQVRESVSQLNEAVSAIREMIYKEQNILYPMSLEVLSEQEWGKVREGEEEIGYAWVQPASEPGRDQDPPARRGKAALGLEIGIHLS